MSAVKHTERALSLSGMLASKVRTLLYRRQGYLAKTARVVGGGTILNPSQAIDRIHVGENSILRGELFAFPHAGRIRIGAWCFIGENSHIWSSDSVTIGDRVLISHDVNIHDTNGHPLEDAARHQQFKKIASTGHPSDISTIKAKPVVIGDDAWIGLNSIIMKGVTIGARSIVAAGSVVVDDVPPDTTVAGNPAHPVKGLAPRTFAPTTGALEDWPQYQD